MSPRVTHGWHFSRETDIVRLTRTHQVNESQVAKREREREREGEMINILIS